MGSGRHLHSHNINTMTGEQEVSGFGDQRNGDDNDDWVVEPFQHGGQQWHVNTQVKFKHSQTGKYLKGHEKMLINSQVGDATAVTSVHHSGEECKWNITFF